jgi:hypothetical protein
MPILDALDRRLGRWQYVVIFVGGGLWNIVVEYPATTFTHLWHYYWRTGSGWTLGHMPMTNAPAAGTTTLLVFLTCRYVYRRHQSAAATSGNTSPLPAPVTRPASGGGGTATAVIDSPAVPVVATSAHPSFLTLTLEYAAAVALAFQLTWTLWTVVLGATMSHWFVPGAGSWITGS